MTALVERWWQRRQQPFFFLEVARRRAELYESILADIRRKLESSHSYDPSLDNRVIWATQWLAVTERRLARVDPAVAACAAFIFDPPIPLDAARRAANDHP